MASREKEVDGWGEMSSSSSVACNHVVGCGVVDDDGASCEIVEGAQYELVAPGT